jgi:hypothetical protein
MNGKRVPNAQGNGRRSPQRARLAGGLAVGIILGALLAAIHFRHILTAAHDPGFSAPPHITVASDSRAGARPIVSADGEFITLEPAGKFLINSITKKPVFITGDSAWSLITQLDNADVELYLSDRASRGFNYIWCAAADNYYQSNAPKNFYGYAPFDGPDFTNEDARYWEHVDYVIRRAQAHGITVALDPAFVGLSSALGYLTSYQRSSDNVIAAYGEFLGERYKSFPNIIWAIGGDVDPSAGVVPKLSELATAIRSKDTVHLIVAEGEPQHAALDTFAGTGWMDLNWLYFHTTNVPAGTASNYSRSPWLPPFQGEGWYENDHSLTELQLREQEYWAVLSGAYLGKGGFGNDPIWYFNGGPSAKSGEPAWRDQLVSAGSLSQMVLGKLFRSREHWKLVPDLGHAVMIAGYDSRGIFSSAWESLQSAVHRQAYRLGSASSVAARTSDGQTIIAYIPGGSAATITIDMSKISDAAAQAKCWWFNPRDGSSALVGTYAASGSREFTPPDANDWVLTLDSASANLPAPGSGDL